MALCWRSASDCTNWETIWKFLQSFIICVVSPIASTFSVSAPWTICRFEACLVVVAVALKQPLPALNGFGSGR